MKKTGLLLLFAFIFCIKTAIGLSPDSLKLKLKGSLPDSVRTRVLVDLSWQLSQENKTDEAMQFVVEARALTEKINQGKELANTYIVSGAIYEKKGNYEAALADYKKCLVLFKKIKFKPGIERALTHIGRCYEWFGRHESAIALYHEELQDAIREKDSADIVRYYLKIGNVYQDAGKYSEAFKTYLTLLNVCEKTNNKHGAFYCLNNIAILFKDQHKYNEAMKYHFHALKVITATGDSLYIAGSLYNIGALYLELLNYDKAYYYNNRALLIYEAIHELENDGDCYFTRGNIYEARGDLKNAFQDYSKAEAIYEKSDYRPGILNASIGLGLLLSRQKDFTAAKPYMDKALAMAYQLNDKEELLKAYTAVSEHHELSGNAKEALNYFKKYSGLKDSLVNENNHETLLKQQMGFEFSKKEEVLKAEVALSVAEKKRKNQIITGISAGLGLMLILALIIFRSLVLNRQKNKIITKQKQIVEEKQKEILDSIKYARRIQASLLPTDKYIDRILKNDKKN